MSLDLGAQLSWLDWAKASQYPGLLPPALDHSIQVLSSTRFGPCLTQTAPQHTGFLVSSGAAYVALPWHSKAHSLIYWVPKLLRGHLLGSWGTHHRICAEARPLTCPYEGSVLL